MYIFKLVGVFGKYIFLHIIDCMNFERTTVVHLSLFFFFLVLYKCLLLRGKKNMPSNMTGILHLISQFHEALFFFLSFFFKILFYF